MTATAIQVGAPPESPSRQRRPGLGAVAVTAAVLLLVVLAGIDVTQGIASVGPVQLWRALLGQADQADTAVILGSRLPRAAAGLVVGLALGTAGAALQAISRNVLAAPDTLAVSSGAYAALAVVSVSGLSLPLLASSAVAFAGGLVAALAALALSGLGSGTIRLVLAGSALGLGLTSITEALILLFPERTTGLYQWSEGSISQSGPAGVQQLAPIVAIAGLGLVLLARRIDALGLGDDAAQSLGVDVRATRIGTVILAVLLSAAAVTLAGPIGFVGLGAPALVRPLARRLPGLLRARSFLPLAGLTGANLVLAADVVLRAMVGAQTSVGVPTGVATSLFGAIVLVFMAFRARSDGSAAPTDHYRVVSRARFWLTLALLIAVLVLVTIAAVLLGDSKLLLGDVVNWAQGRSGRTVTYVLDTRLPRVLAALAAGAALALAGALVQAVTRNPLAEPGILGVSGGAGLGAVLLVTTVPLAGSWSIAGASFAGAALTAVIVFGLAARGGFQQNRLVLIGVGVSTAATALISLLIVLTDPFNATKALIWLSGSTYGRTLPDVVPVALVLLAATLGLAVRHRELDLISLDDDTPRLLGLRIAPARLLFLSLSVLLTGTAVAAVGVIGFVGLIAPHAARSLVGRRHSRVIPVSLLLGAILVEAADLLGRTVIAPQQLGAGLLTAVIGTPYFLWLLRRSRS
jgi:iron complex transport system permease protein